MSTTIREVLLQSRLLIVSMLLALISITAQASDDNVISVSATGKVNVTPDIAKFVLLVEKTAPIASKAKQLTNDSVSQLLSNFKRYNIDKDTIDSGQISVSPTYNYDDGKQSLTGYRVVRTVLFELNNLNQFESILNDITESGVTHIQSISFDTKDRKSAHTLALKDAAQKAREAALTIAESFRVKLGKLAHVEHNMDQKGNVRPMRAMAFSADAAESSNSSYEIKDIEIRAHIIASFLIK